MSDINECLAGGVDCGQNAECINLRGSYECRCADGYGGSCDNCISKLM